MPLDVPTAAQQAYEDLLNTMLLDLDVASLQDAYTSNNMYGQDTWYYHNSSEAGAELLPFLMKDDAYDQAANTIYRRVLSVPNMFHHPTNIVFMLTDSSQRSIIVAFPHFLTVKHLAKSLNRTVIGTKADNFTFGCAETKILGYLPAAESIPLSTIQFKMPIHAFLTGMVSIDSSPHLVKVLVLAGMRKPHNLHLVPYDCTSISSTRWVIPEPNSKILFSSEDIDDLLQTTDLTAVHLRKWCFRFLNDHGPMIQYHDPDNSYHSGKHDEFFPRNQAHDVSWRVATISPLIPREPVVSTFRISTANEPFVHELDGQKDVIFGKAFGTQFIVTGAPSPLIPCLQVICDEVSFARPSSTWLSATYQACIYTWFDAPVILLLDVDQLDMNSNMVLLSLLTTYLQDANIIFNRHYFDVKVSMPDVISINEISRLCDLECDLCMSITSTAMIMCHCEWNHVVHRCFTCWQMTLMRQCQSNYERLGCDNEIGACDQCARPLNFTPVRGSVSSTLRKTITKTDNLVHGTPRCHHENDDDFLHCHKLEVHVPFMYMELHRSYDPNSSAYTIQLIEAFRFNSFESATKEFVRALQLEKNRLIKTLDSAIRGSIHHLNKQYAQQFKNIKMGSIGWMALPTPIADLIAHYQGNRNHVQADIILGQWDLRVEFDSPLRPVRREHANVGSLPSTLGMRPRPLVAAFDLTDSPVARRQRRYSVID